MRYLMYAEVPLSSEAVQRSLSGLATDGSVTALVPVRDLSANERQFLEIEHSVDDLPATHQFASWRLRDTIAALESVGFANVEGDTVDGPALDAIETAVESGDFDAVVVVTEPAGVVGWVHLDLTHRVERHVEQPVIHIEVEPAHRGF